MIDIQSLRDDRGVFLERVGIRDLRLPINLRVGDRHLATVATFSLSVSLEKEVKGTHMSRFVEIIQAYPNINPYDVKPILDEMKEKLKANEAYMTMSFPYFIEKVAPVSKKSALTDIECRIEASLKDDFLYKILLNVPIATLCPCSKAISDYGAHNQRTMAVVSVEPSDCNANKVSIEFLVNIIEASASCELYPLLKREDEKFVTEKAYDNPKFVEDVARDLYKELDEMPDIKDFDILIESLESIHNHNAFAYTSKKGGERA